MFESFPAKLAAVALTCAAAFQAFGAGTATVVRVHPRLTRGLAREALFGIRFDNSYGGAMSDLHLSFAFTNCTSDVLGDLKVWYQPYNSAMPYIFRESKATQINSTRTATSNADKSFMTATLGGCSTHIYPCVGTRTESDYIWVTATINPSISPDAEIWVSVSDSTITLGGSSVYNVANGTASAPHRVFPYAYQVGTYIRQDWTHSGSVGNLSNGDGNRVKGLTDIILINDMNVRYVQSTDGFDTTWDAYSGRNDTQTATAIRALRDRYNEKCMVRASLTRGSAKVTARGVTGYPIAVAAANGTYRKQLVNAIVKVLENNKLDGLDIDWEYPGVDNYQIESADLCARDWGYYGLLVRDLAVAFFERGWVLSLCTDESGWAMPGFTVSTDTCGGVLHGVDFINSMAYGNTSINSSPQAMMNGINVATANGVPQRRVVVGQAMYASENGNPGWSTIANALPSYWGDDKTRWWDGDCMWNSKRTFEGPSSYHAKCNWCRENGLGGVMSWGYYTDVGWYNGNYLCLARHQSKAIWPDKYYRHPAPPKDGSTYLIDSEDDWAWLRENAGSAISARLSADITLGHDPLPIETWSGTLDGDGHTITIPFETWLCHSDQPALIRNLTGTVKNLNIDFGGRVVSRSSRWNDTSVSQGSTASTITVNSEGLATGHHAAVLACMATGSSGGTVVSNVTLRIRKDAEVQGPNRTGGLFGEIWAGSGTTVKIEDCTVVVAGMIRTLARNTSEGDLSLQYGVAGAIAGNVNAAGSVSVRNCTVILEPSARVEVQTGTSTAAGGAFGNINNTVPDFDGVEVYAANDASISAANGASNVGATSYASWNRSHAESVCSHAARHLYFELDSSAEEGVRLVPAVLRDGEGFSVRVRAENADGASVPLTKWARPWAVYLDGNMAEAETVEATDFSLVDGEAVFSLPAPPEERNPCLFKVQLRAGY
ncbi:MAG: glycoside hydrolase family 18 protein [Kiritimatiellae bacterium]|nr:glycoside hydrolase family 18 protein [Kiritimatiellia bacterium]